MAQKNTKKRILQILSATIGFLLIAAGSYFLYVQLVAPKKSIVQAPLAVAKASVKKKTEQEKQAYTVPPSHPRELIIKKLGVDANVLPIGTTEGVLDAPGSAWDAGWYDKSALPGQGGALLLDGHVNDALGSPGIFYSLTNLVKGDEMIIERGDGQKFTYAVTAVQDIPLEKVDMNKVAASAQAGKEGLNLITCGGLYDYQKKTYDHRIIVYAVRMPPAA
jgi:LPXTG-site transpeptidase (sortase) family protein